MRVLVIGSGGREHALAWKLNQSPRVDQLISCPGNGGLAELGDLWTDLDPVRDGEALVARAVEFGIELAVIGPEAPLVAGLADRMRAAGIPTFGPNARAAQLEGSKAFSKEFMRRHHVPTATSVTVQSAAELEEAWGQFSSPPVVKADGLAAGKGVIVAESWDEAREAASAILVDGRFGEAGQTLVLEERLEGTEVTLSVLVSGDQHQVLETAQDYKCRFDGDQGPNTGGMGAISPAHNFDPTARQRVLKEVLRPTLDGLVRDDLDYRGVLYVGLMLTATGPKVLEYNVRFGDPETQPLMARLDSDLVDALLATEESRLDSLELRWKPDAAVCVVLAHEEYPSRSSKDRAIRIDSVSPGTTVFHAGTRPANSTVVTAGGRVLGVTSIATTLAEACEQTYREIAQVEFEGMSFRRDIGRPSQ